ncbi:hypothetical protein PFISCL1PPCAC_10286 [Pristionchus fissidentatus]|uniref:Nephrocystin 3-like N-terminal domain-containing protein n=1 Tax=Pristionchus fissidentatus TaxID=1538716 RepID=A0AAV5VKR4_9BILA|nr:hypothetical protein PFISCL1PPCAC_10286 [Pristionchus fissidentatus]
MKALIKRERSAEAFEAWLAGCSQPLLISSPPYTGKTTFVKQIATESECAAAHYCSRAEPASIDTASVLRNLATQLVRRFPNLVLPYLSSVTLLADISTSIDHYLALPLASLPLPPKPLFIVIDNALSDIYDVIFKLHSSLPSWLKLVITTRTLPSDEYLAHFSSFHEFSLSGEGEELRQFAHSRLPQCCEDDVMKASMGSWFYVDQVARALDYGILQPDQLPIGTEQLLQLLCSSPALPARLSLYLMLIKAARRPPSHSDLLSVGQIIINDVLPSIQKDLEDLSPILACSDPVILSGSWVDFEGDLSPYHSAWADHYKVKKRKSPQDLVELAYHLAHSNTPMESSVLILHSLGASRLCLSCPVFDELTTTLLERVGCTVERADEQEDFVFLCSLGDLKRITELLAADSSSPPSPSSISLGFLAAASRGHVRVCEQILDRRPETIHSSSSQSDSQWNALRAAACGDHLGVLEMLIQRGVPVDECGNGGRTALRAAAWAGHREIVACLLKAKGDVEKRDSEGRTALMAAAFMENHEIVEDLLRSGADVNCVDSSGATALHLVLSNGCKSERHRLTLNTLLNFKANSNLSDSHGRACIHLAAYHGDECIETIARYADQIDLQDSDGRTPLMLAASQGQMDSVQMLVSRGADIDAIDEQGRTALMLGAIHGHLAIVDLLLSMGADEGHKDNDGATALHYAVRHKCVELTRALATTSTVSTCDSQGNTPLIVAAEYPNVEVISVLLHCGSSPSAQSLHGLSALRVAALAGHVKIVRMLSERVSDCDQRDVEGTPLLHSLLISSQLSMASTLLSLGASPLSRDVHGRTAAHIVCSRDDVAAARMLLRTTREAGLFEERDDGGRSPLLTAVWAGHYSIASFLLEVANVDPNAVDKQGASSLSVAVQLGHRELVHLLLRLGADPSIRDKAGRTAHDVARITGKENIRVMLKSATGSADSSGFGSMPASPLEMNRSAPLLHRRNSFVLMSAAPF